MNKISRINRMGLGQGETFGGLCLLSAKVISSVRLSSVSLLSFFLSCSSSRSCSSCHILLTRIGETRTWFVVM